MAAPRVFWVSVSIAILTVAASVSYMLLVVLPAAQRHKDDLKAELTAKQARDKQVTDCAEQARQTAADFGKYSSVFSGVSKVSGESNHYNRKLGKCIVDVQTVMENNGTSENLLDAYEQSSTMMCVTTFTPKASVKFQRTCLDSKNQPIDPTEADKQIDSLLRE